MTKQQKKRRGKLLRRTGEQILETGTQEHLAKIIATKAHEGQVDKAGKPYINHSAAVAAMVEGDACKAAAWLHDVVEDTSMALADLADAGVCADVLGAVGLLTHRPNMPYRAYITSIGANDIARAVKIADLRHNSDLSRLKEVTAADITRAEKYKHALEYLLAED